MFDSAQQQKTSNPMASFGRRKTDSASAAQIAEERAANRRRGYLTIAVAAFGLALGAWHWQAGLVFIGLTALIASIPTSK